MSWLEVIDPRVDNVYSMDKLPVIQGFPPLVAEGARVLILGSMPGEASIRAQAYYAHPRNTFWPIMAELFEFDLTLPYAQRVAELQARGVAVWDVLQACQRQGSLDTAICLTSEVPNDFERFFECYPQIDSVFCNGEKAWKSFNRHVLKPLALESLNCQRLPSTSPAHASLSFQAKLDAWQVVADALISRQP
ncbi:DNA-deoxyinosine glycosylase [Nitrincola sp.]|uniref:DNA-deoxyinosine glycosylase n=1 Tax=Nitrincola sp. TaxID=1926584 RepID=UPI003A916BEB